MSVLAFIYLFRTLDSVKVSLVTYISIGTMVIFGFHRILIGIIDYSIEETLNIYFSYSRDDVIAFTQAEIDACPEGVLNVNR